MSLSPACLGVTRLDLAARFPSPEKISLSSRSALVVTGKAKITFEALELDGALRIECPTPGQAVTVRLGADQAGGHQAGGVVNAGWALEPLGEGEPAEEVLAIRGYRLVKVRNMRVPNDTCVRGEFFGPFGCSVSWLIQLWCLASWCPLQSETAHVLIQEAHGKHVVVSKVRFFVPPQGTSKT